MMNARGFTLIELLVTIAVAAIMATIAVPGFQGMMASNRVASDYNEILSGLNHARSEAIKRRENVTFRITQANGEWAYEILVGGNELALRSGRDDKVTVDPVIVVFNSLGRRQSCTTSNCITTISRGDKSERIQVSITGRIGKPTS
ncbi:prepilin-type N-terminal cleavage/methylation domain-containing protein [Halomonas sp. DQ26W]|uniref:GspH/FimT family pseudopilin n=1 Tax=Halomonas sp. DQ26W TaxID=2282311 RepID=UPI000DF846D1|nr:GspH/FimT family pseudopilin [Halomonas sp. DQ26W]RDB42292.1 prepilin-type N-terminal cleavage/methylation domain-containing protein [Halomonas sp. DQ26W]